MALARLHAARVALLALTLAGGATRAGAADDGWVQQKQRTRDFVFSLRFASEVVRPGASGAPTRLRIVRRQTGQVLQEIAIAEAYPVDVEPDRRIQVVDANRDGHPDIDLYAIGGDAGPNDGHDFYLFDARLDKFKLDEKLSALSQVEFHRDGRITSSYRGGCCDHTDQTWRYVGRRLVLVESREEHVVGDVIVTTRGWRVGGKMRFAVRKTAVASEAAR